jgi:putative ABC transport system permease protein
MYRSAIAMLVGDRGRFLALVAALAFATLLISQQAGTFLGVMASTHGFVSDAAQVPIWVMDPRLNGWDAPPLNDREVQRVRAVAGVAWAVPYHRSIELAALGGGETQRCALIGVDSATWIGGPFRLVSGRIEDLRRPGAVIVEQHALGRRLRSGAGADRRAMAVGDRFVVAGTELEVVGVVDAAFNLTLEPNLVASLDTVRQVTGSSRVATHLLVGAAPGEDCAAVCARIRAETGLEALTSAAYEGRIFAYFLRETGIPANFAVAVGLGFLVGIAITGLLFSQFVADHRRAFAALKAMGIGDGLLLRLVVAQAALTGLLGFGLGLGASAVFGAITRGTDLSFRLPPQLMLACAAAIVGISVCAALASTRQIMRLDPAQVFRT